MKFYFYFCSIMSIITTFLCITRSNLMHALVCLILSTFSIAGIFFCLGAYFAGALEIIIYSGAIMVLFAFVIMIISIKQKKYSYSVFFNKINFAIFFMSILVYAMKNNDNKFIKNTVIDTQEIGKKLFGSYILIVELISILLLASLIISYHFGKKYYLKKQYPTIKNMKE